jgi:hypothetical protein
MNLSLILPTKGRYPELKKQLKIISKSLGSIFEIIVVIDGDSQSLSIVSEFEDKFKKKLIIINNEYSQGLNISNIKGFEKSKGELVSFISDDNYLVSDFASYSIRLHRKYKKAAMVFGNMQNLVDGKIKSISKPNINLMPFQSIQIESKDFKSMFMEGHAPFCSTSATYTYKRKFLEQSNLLKDCYNELHSPIGDDLLINILGNRHKSVYVNRVLVTSNEDTSSTLSSNMANIEFRKTIRKRIQLENATLHPFYKKQMKQGIAKNLSYFSTDFDKQVSQLIKEKKKYPTVSHFVLYKKNSKKRRHYFLNPYNLFHMISNKTFDVKNCILWIDAEHEIINYLRPDTDYSQINLLIKILRKGVFVKEVHEKVTWADTGYQGPYDLISLKKNLLEIKKNLSAEKNLKLKSRCKIIFDYLRQIFQSEKANYCNRKTEGYKKRLVVNRELKQKNYFLYKTKKIQLQLRISLNNLLEFIHKKAHKKSSEMINEVYDEFFKLGQLK